MKITVIGTGYVGLVSGACLAERGHEIACLDVDAGKIARLLRGEIPIHEPGLEELVRENVARGRLRFSTEAEETIPGAEAVLIAVGTPPSPDGSADMRFVFSAVETVARFADRPLLIVTKSTVPVGTSAKISALLKRLCNVSYDVVSNPELLREGKAVQDFMQPSRIIFGASSPLAAKKMLRMYASWDCPKLVMSPASAELAKYAANAFLATKISFINEMAELAETLGADVEDVSRGMGLDPRIGKDFLKAGLGWGGSCFPKDVAAIQRAASDRGVRLPVITAAEETNAKIRPRMVERLSQMIGGLAGKTVAQLGLAFKGGTDDTRESPALSLARAWIEQGAVVRAFDPQAVVMEKMPPPFTRCDSAYDAAHGADAIVVATEWDEFRLLDLAKLRGPMRGGVLMDARNLLDPRAAKEAGFRYFSIGRDHANA